MRFLSLLGLQLLIKIAASQTSYFINPPDSSASSNGLTIQEGTVYTVTWQTNLPFVALTLWAEGDNNFEYPCEPLPRCFSQRLFPNDAYQPALAI